MDNPQSFPDVFKKIVATQNKLNLHQADLIYDLIYRCGALEAIQHRLFTVLAETNAPAHSQILDEVKSVLSSAEAKGVFDGPAVDHFRSLLDEKAGKKVQLRLVPKRPSPAIPQENAEDPH